MKLQPVYILVLEVCFNLISLTNEYSFSRMDHVINTMNSQVNIEDSILLKLKLIERKIIDNKFDENDLIQLYGLVDTIKNIEERIFTPTVYWYSRQGR